MNIDPKHQQHVDTFTSVFQPLVDADPATTTANLVPVLGDHLNSSLLGVLGTFLSNWFFETVDISNESYVVLQGRRLPISSIAVLNDLVKDTPPGVLSRLIDGLASLPADLSFPDSFVDTEEHETLNRVRVAKDELYKVVTGGSTVDDAMRSGAYQARISEPDA